uniref:Uncharacterized protein n=1 Tax=Meloidogyne enterolobii TaxID=390850 RepID=A0A6V7VTG7_MELEN|nr:unnamed protein product [Meloidogyne enterolobii]
MVNMRTKRTGQPTTIQVVIQTMQTCLHLVTKRRMALSILLVAGIVMINLLAPNLFHIRLTRKKAMSASLHLLPQQLSRFNMRLNPENIQESNVTEVPRSSQHKDESSSQDEYFMATNELSSNSSEMYFSDAVSEEKVVPRLMPEYNLYSTQQKFRNCAVEACNMNTFLQLIECSFPQECSEQILNNLFFDYHQLDVKKCGRIQLLLLDGKVMVFFCIFLSFFKNVRHFVTIYF